MVDGVSTIGGTGSVEDATDAFIMGVDGKAVKAAVASIVGSDEINEPSEDEDGGSDVDTVIDVMRGVAVKEDGEDVFGVGTVDCWSEERDIGVFLRKAIRLGRGRSSRSISDG